MNLENIRFIMGGETVTRGSSIFTNRREEIEKDCFMGCLQKDAGREVAGRAFGTITQTRKWRGITWKRRTTVGTFAFAVSRSRMPNEVDHHIGGGTHLRDLLRGHDAPREAIRSFKPVRATHARMFNIDVFRTSRSTMRRRVLSIMLSNALSERLPESETPAARG